jgi:hypothetical protein
MDASSHQPTLSQSASSVPSSLSPLHSYSNSHSQAVFDRYDLLSPNYLSSSFDFTQSEAGEYGGTHSAFSDADLFLSNSFRGFTHHSNTAGDLIFGTRSQQGPSGHGNVHNRFQTEDSGLHNSMQLHAIPERVDSIRISDPSAAQPSGLPAAAELGPSLSASLPLTDIHSMQPLSVPSQATTQPFTIDTNHRIFAPDPEAAITPTFSQPVTQPPTTSTSPISSHAYPISPRSISLQPHNRMPFSGPYSSTSQDLFSQSAGQDVWNLMDPFAFLNSNHLSGFGEDIPFLDLHYWGSNPTHVPMEMSTSAFTIDHTTGALDLAQSPVQRNHPRSTGTIPRPAPPVTADPQLSGNQTKVNRPSLSNHQRVQSAVSSFDFQSSYNNDHKRKRVSWDGGH